MNDDYPDYGDDEYDKTHYAFSLGFYGVWHVFVFFGLFVILLLACRKLVAFAIDINKKEERGAWIAFVLVIVCALAAIGSAVFVSSFNAKYLFRKGFIDNPKKIMSVGISIIYLVVMLVDWMRIITTKESPLTKSTKTITQ